MRVLKVVYNIGKVRIVMDTKFYVLDWLSVEMVSHYVVLFLFCIKNRRAAGFPWGKSKPLTHAIQEFIRIQLC